MLLASDKAHPSLRFSARTIIVFILLWRFLKRREHKDFFAKDAEICTHSLRSLRLNLCVLCVKHFLPIGTKIEIYFFGTTLCFFQSRLARAPLSRSSGIAVPGVRLLSDELLKSKSDDVFINQLKHAECVISKSVNGSKYAAVGKYYIAKIDLLLQEYILHYIPFLILD